MNLLFLGNLFCAAIGVITTGKSIFSLAVCACAISITGAYSTASVCRIFIFVAEVFAAFSTEICFVSFSSSIFCICPLSGCSILKPFLPGPRADNLDIYFFCCILNAFSGSLPLSPSIRGVW